VKIWKLLGVAMMLAQARLVINRVQWVGPGAVAASERRKRARANAYDPYHGVASLRNQHRYSTRLPSPFSKWGLMTVPELNQ
jgi:hypothetical protein